MTVWNIDNTPLLSDKYLLLQRIILFVQMKISLPEEDPKTIDVDVKADKVTFVTDWYNFKLDNWLTWQVLLFSYHYKCLAYWNGKIKPSLASTTWNGDTSLLVVKAPVLDWRVSKVWSSK